MKLTATQVPRNSHLKNTSTPSHFLAAARPGGVAATATHTDGARARAPVPVCCIYAARSDSRGRIRGDEEWGRRPHLAAPLLSQVALASVFYDHNARPHLLLLAAAASFVRARAYKEGPHRGMSPTEKGPGQPVQPPSRQLFKSPFRRGREPAVRPDQQQLSGERDDVRLIVLLVVVLRRAATTSAKLFPPSLRAPVPLFFTFCQFLLPRGRRGERPPGVAGRPPVFLVAGPTSYACCCCRCPTLPIASRRADNTPCIAERTRGPSSTRERAASSL